MQTDKWKTPVFPGVHLKNTKTAIRLHLADVEQHFSIGRKRPVLLIHDQF
jgi:hypothetical protein